MSQFIENTVHWKQARRSLSLIIVSYVRRTKPCNKKIENVYPRFPEDHIATVRDVKHGRMCLLPACVYKIGNANVINKLLLPSMIANYV